MIRPFAFEISHADSGCRARTGVLKTRSGAIATPCLVGGTRTLAAAFPLTGKVHEFIHSVDIIETLMAPGMESIEARGGLGGFHGLGCPVLTFPGTIDASSMLDSYDIGRDGLVCMRAPLSGKSFQFTPESVMDACRALRPDITVALDAFNLSGRHLPDRDEARIIDISADWAERSLAVRPDCTALFAVVHGGADLNLRAGHAQRLAGSGFDGFVVGALPSRKSSRISLLTAVTDNLPEESPRYLPGDSSPGDMLTAIVSGIDLVDADIAYRWASAGFMATSNGLVSLKNSRLIHSGGPILDGGPIDPGCGCPVCARFPAARLLQMHVTFEPVGSVLATIHNLWFINRIFAGARTAIATGKIDEFQETTRRMMLDDPSRDSGIPGHRPTDL